MFQDFDWSGIVRNILNFIRSNALGLIIVIAVVFIVERLAIFMVNRYIYKRG